MSGGSPTYDIIGMERFTQACDAHYQDGVFTLACQIRHNDGNVYNYHRSVDLRPAIKYIHEKLVDWHRAQHGDTEVAGWTDWVKSAYHSAEHAAKAVAHSKLGKELWKQIKEHKGELKALAAQAAAAGASAYLGPEAGPVAGKLAGAIVDSSVPDPKVKAAAQQVVAQAAAAAQTNPAMATVMQTAQQAVAAAANGTAPTLTTTFQASSLYDQAKTDPTALDKIKQLMALADSGDSKAQYAVRVMQNLSNIQQNNVSASQEQPKPKHHSFYDAGLGVSGTSVGYRFAHYQGGWARDRRSKRGYGRVVQAPGTRPGGIARMANVVPPALARLHNNPALLDQMTQALPVQSDPYAAPQEQSYSDQGGYGGNDQQGYGQNSYDDQGYDQGYDDQGYDQGYYDQGYDDQGYDQGYDQSYDQGPAPAPAPQPVVRDHRVSGWLYNRPYRTTSDTMVQLQQSPGVGFAIREMYNRGLGRQQASTSSFVSSFLKQL